MAGVIPLVKQPRSAQGLAKEWKESQMDVSEVLNHN